MNLHIFISERENMQSFKKIGWGILEELRTQASKSKTAVTPPKMIKLKILTRMHIFIWL